MNYFIKRDLQEYGPYSLADLQRYVQQGNIALSDLARSDGMTDWIPVSQIIGNAGMPPPPANPQVAAPQSSQIPANQFGSVGGGSPYAAPATPYGVPGAYGGAPQQMYGGSMYPPPPSLHWALILVISMFCGIFIWIWMFIQASWVKKVRPQCNAILLYSIGLAATIGGYIVGVIIVVAGNHNSDVSAVGGLVIIVGVLGGSVLIIVGNFSMRSAIEDFYNKEEPIGLQLSGVMTFFFHVLYFQYHFTRITEMKRMASMQRPGGYGV